MWVPILYQNIFSRKESIKSALKLLKHWRMLIQWIITGRKQICFCSVIYYGSDRPSWVRWSFSTEKRKRAKYKPPAMRVRDVCYTKNHLSVIIEVFRPLLKKGKVISWQSKRIRSHIRSGCVSITSSSPLSIEEKLFIINTKEICGISWNNCAVIKEWRYWKDI